MAAVGCGAAEYCAGGAFAANTETVDSRYFGIDELPLLAEEKNNEEQIRMCFEAYQAKHWTTLFD